MVPNFKNMSQLGNRRQLGLLGLGFAPGLVALHFSYFQICTLVATVYLHIRYQFLCIRGCRNGWMASDQFG